MATTEINDFDDDLRAAAAEHSTAPTDSKRRRAARLKLYGLMAEARDAGLREERISELTGIYYVNDVLSRGRYRAETPEQEAALLDVRQALDAELALIDRAAEVTQSLYSRAEVEASAGMLADKPQEQTEALRVLLGYKARRSVDRVRWAGRYGVPLAGGPDRPPVLENLPAPSKTRREAEARIAERVAARDAALLAVEDARERTTVAVRAAVALKISQAELEAMGVGSKRQARARRRTGNA